MKTLVETSETNPAKVVCAQCKSQSTEKWEGYIGRSIRYEICAKSHTRFPLLCYPSGDKEAAQMTSSHFSHNAPSLF